ncbi:sensor histidine kinase [Streptomyces sp. NBC_01465]
MAPPEQAIYGVGMPKRFISWAAGHAPWSAWAWRNTAFAVAALPMAALTGLALAYTFSDPSAQHIASTLAFMLLLNPLLTAVQRSRFRSLLGLDIPKVHWPHPRYAPRGVFHRLRAESTWRQFGYHLVVSPLAALGGALVVCAWATGVAFALVFSWAWALPPVDQSKGWTMAYAGITVGGVLLLFATPWLAAAIARIDANAAAALLGPNRAKVLEQRVEDLAESRAGVLDAADLERRRIERDLHDGAQQRLVSLAMNLGIARATLTDLPPEARAVIDEAHREAKEAIEELNNLVRGLHPAVLEDRGLDAALSGIAARAPLPVELGVDIAVRPSPTVEAVAYFVVSEALANVAKHARADRVSVQLKRVGDLLRVTVTDDGAGGADASRGTGLAGLAKRVGSVDGSIRINSPRGGPTVITVELPCGL